MLALNIFCQLSFWMMNFCPHPYTFAYNLSYFGLWAFVFGIRIWIHKVAEYASNLDPDPQHLMLYVY